MTKSETKFRMMNGTSTEQTYLLIGRRGDVAVGIKPDSFRSGVTFGSPGNTWFGAKLRVAYGGNLFVGEGGADVVAFKDMVKYDRPAAAFPSIKWTADDSMRASTVLGMLLEGDIKGGSDDVQKFVANLKDQALSIKIADYLVELLGAENMLTSRDDIIEWFELTFSPMIERILLASKASENFVKELEGGIGHFGIHASMLQKAYKKAQGHMTKSPSDGHGHYDDEDEFED